MANNNSNEDKHYEPTDRCTQYNEKKEILIFLSGCGSYLPESNLTIPHAGEQELAIGGDIERKNISQIAPRENELWVCAGGVQEHDVGVGWEHELIFDIGIDTVGEPISFCRVNIADVIFGSGWVYPVGS